MATNGRCRRHLKLTSRDIGSREDDVFLVLVDRPGVGDRLVVFDHGDRLAGEDGLVDPEAGRVDLDETEVGGDLVADGDLHNVAGYQVDSLD